ncbi:D-2-hydroxyacid dehydrogenase [Thalassorhabdus alkalitolerans]|uniref:D-2-hydroxyacid dehydrogenase n=1 Tax=Thalassorhabdus alkalitolerans TaxID=2282697 RepID=A0ABW0YT77_9BACI
MRIVSSAKIKTALREDLEESFQHAEFRFFGNIDEARSSLPEADVLITYGEDLTAREIKEAKNLKWIMVISAGMDLMPFEAIQDKGIMVTNARGIHKKPMAEYTMAMILQYARQASIVRENEERRRWDRKVTMTEINQQSIGILGPGAIGGEIARLAKAFGMKTMGYNRSGRPVEHVDHIYSDHQLDQLLRVSDYVVSVLPATEETHNMADRSFFQKMKETGVFINIGRGSTVKEEELIHALDNGELAHAILDVFKEEPLPEDHPFWEMEKVTVTPHLSGISPQYHPRALEIFKRNLEVFLAGGEEYINSVDTSKGY